MTIKPIGDSSYHKVAVESTQEGHVRLCVYSDEDKEGVYVDLKPDPARQVAYLITGAVRDAEAGRQESRKHPKHSLIEHAGDIALIVGPATAVFMLLTFCSSH